MSELLLVSLLLLVSSLVDLTAAANGIVPDGMSAVFREAAAPADYWMKGSDE